MAHCQANPYDNRPFDEAREFFSLFSKLLKQIRTIAMAPEVSKGIADLQGEAEEFLGKMNPNFNLERFRAASVPDFPEEAA